MTQFINLALLLGIYIYTATIQPSDSERQVSLQEGSSVKFKTPTGRDIKHKVTTTAQPSSDSQSSTQQTVGGEDAGLQFHREKKSWIGALQYCRGNNYDLVEITNATVQKAVTSLLQNKTGLQDGVWIGLERSIFGIDIPWQWVSGEIVGKEAQWNSTTFVNALNHHCGKIIQLKEEFKWLDADCHDKLPFICRDPTRMQPGQTTSQQQTYENGGTMAAAGP